MARCLVHTCFSRYSKSSDITFHQLPTDTLCKQVWLNAIKRDSSEQFSDRNVICSKHFLPEDFQKTKGNRRVVNKKAVPSQNLPTDICRKRKIHYDMQTVLPLKSFENQEGTSAGIGKKVYNEKQIGSNYKSEKENVLKSSTNNIVQQLKCSKTTFPNEPIKSSIGTDKGQKNYYNILPDLQVAQSCDIGTNSSLMTNILISESSSKESGIYKRTKEKRRIYGRSAVMQGRLQRKLLERLKVKFHYYNQKIRQMRRLKRKIVYLTDKIRELNRKWESVYLAFHNFDGTVYE